MEGLWLDSEPCLRRYGTPPTDFALHADYPLLLVDLVAATGLVSGASEPWAGMVWGPVFAIAVWLAARAWLAGSLGSSLTFQLAVAVVGLYLGFSAVAFLRATDAGWLLALALLLDVPAPTRGLRRPGDYLPLGFAAALAVASKLLGTPLDIFLAVAAAWPGGDRVAGGQEGDGAPLRWPGLPVPPLALGLTWAVTVAHHGPFAETNWSWSRVGSERLVTEARAMLKFAVQSLWLGFSALTLLLLAGLWLAPGKRRLAAMLTLQIEFYLAAYLATPVDIEHLV